jgi:hypothetical protein
VRTPETARWFLIYKHNRSLGETRAVVDEVRGESRAVKFVETLEAQLSEEDRIAGWSYERAGYGTARPRRFHPPQPRRKHTSKSRSYTGR